MTEKDMINHPAHYENGPYECILLTEQYSFNVGNMIKYVWRHTSKGHKTDLEKAYWYVQRAYENDESFSPCTRYRYSAYIPADRQTPLKSSYDATTLLLLKAANTTDETEKQFWQFLADGNQSGVISVLQTMIEKA